MNSIFLNKSKGFTLLELLIAMSILALTCFGVHQATVETYQLRDRLSMEGELQSQVRLAMNLLQQDVASLYSPTLLLNLPPSHPFHPPLGNRPAHLSETLVPFGDDLSIGSQFWSPAISELGLRPSRFVGTADQVTWVNNAHVRIYQETHESEFAKITYAFKKDQDSQAAPGSFILFRTESTQAFSLDDSQTESKKFDSHHPFTHTIPLLKGIQKFSWHYALRDGNTWKTFPDWDSDRIETKNSYPQKIELNFEMVYKKKEHFTGRFLFRPEAPFYGLPATF